ncbi:MAG: DNA cytosine methyltransferase [Pseudomonadota bacterium]
MSGTEQGRDAPLPRALELFSGIGGWTAAAEGLLDIAAAWDLSEAANTAYAHNWGRDPDPRNLAGAIAGDLGRHGEAGWLMSPPCQPYTQKGEQLDVDDPRAVPLLRLLRILHEVMPPFLLLENVPPFGESRARERLIQKLTSLEYHLREVELCPTEIGIPNLRRRYYLVARRTPLPEAPPLPRFDRSLGSYLDPAPDPELIVDQDVIRRRGRGMDFVTPDSPRTACFGSSYGRAMKRAGSYLSHDGVTRRFSPEEMIRLLHFPDTFTFPSDLPVRTRYKLAGNSVNVAVLQHLVRWVLMP